MKGCRGIYGSCMFQCRQSVRGSLVNQIVTPGSNERSSSVLLPVTHWIYGEEIVTYKFELKVTRGTNRRGGSHEQTLREEFSRSWDVWRIFVMCVDSNSLLEKLHVTGHSTICHPYPLGRLRRRSSRRQVLHRLHRWCLACTGALSLDHRKTFDFSALHVKFNAVQLLWCSFTFTAAEIGI